MDLSDVRSSSNRGRGEGEVFKGVGLVGNYVVLYVTSCIYIYIYISYVFCCVYIYIYLDIQTIFLGFRVSWGLAYPIS